MLIQLKDALYVIAIHSDLEMTALSLTDAMLILEVVNIILQPCTVEYSLLYEELSPLYWIHSLRHYHTS